MGALTDIIIPPWARWLAIASLAAALGGFCYLKGLDHGLEKYTDYVVQQAAQTAVVVKREVQVVSKTEIVYRDRIQKIYVQGEQIENRIPEILTPAVDQRLPLPAGFVRILDAAWSGDTAGPATGADGEPSAIPPSIVAANESENVTSCKVWRVQALKWRDFYAGQQIAVNGRAGDWYKESPAE